MASGKWEVTKHCSADPEELVVDICRVRGANVACINILINARENRMTLVYNGDKQDIEVPLEFLT